MWVGMIPRVTLRFTLGYEPLALHGHSTFQVVWSVVLTRIFTELGGFPQIILGQRDKQVTIILDEAARVVIGCHQSSSPRPCGGLMGLGN